jgi:hypothetical protein
MAIGDRWWSQEYGCVFTETIDSVFAHEDILAMLGSTEKPLLEMCDEKWPADRPDSPAAKAGLDLAAMLASDARPLTEM